MTLSGAVVGSLEILGNPTGLVRSIGTGVADFFRMPYRGLTRGPGAFVMGVSNGTSSMVKNITTGKFFKPICTEKCILHEFKIFFSMRSSFPF